MKTVKQLEDLVAEQIASGIPLQLVAWNAAKACVGWPYVYGAVGEKCKPAKRSQYGTKFYLKSHETIVTKCKAISWDTESQTCKVTGDCSGCKWNLPVMMFDCRGLTRKLLQMVFNWTLWGGTVGGQWNDERNWKANGSIADGMPKDTLCCLFVYNGKWKHTGFGYNNETVECSSGVQYFSTRNKKWTHWAVPKCIEEDLIVTQTTPKDPDEGSQTTTKWRPTIRKGNKGDVVRECQKMLQQLGYNLGICGVDGDYGTATDAAVRAFQREHGLVADGICGPMTWDALDKAVQQIDQKPVDKTYTVMISGLDLTQAQAIAGNYPGAVIKEGSVV